MYEKIDQSLAIVVTCPVQKGHELRLVAAQALLPEKPNHCWRLTVFICNFIAILCLRFSWFWKYWLDKSLKVLCEVVEE